MTTASQHFDDAFQPRPLVRRTGHTLFGPLTIWLLLAMAAGLWIGISDGFTRPYVPDAEFLPSAQILSYEPYKSAWIFAAVALPFLLLHGAKLKFRLTESLLLWFALCTAAYTKDFAYMKVPGAPIYVTDIMLVWMLTGVFVWPRLRIPKARSGLMRSMLLFLLLGAVGAARGVAMRMDFVDVLRDFSIVVYALFTMYGVFSQKRKEFAEQFCLMLVCGALISTVVGVSWYLSEPDMRRYINYLYVPTAFVLVLGAVVNRRLKTGIGVFILMLLGWGLIVSNTRSTYAAMIPTFVLMVLSRIGQFRWKDILKPLLVAVVVIVITFGTMLQSREGARYMDRITEQIVSLVAHGSDDDNTQWRLLAWAEALHRFATNPLIGEGFGVPLTFDRSDVDSKPHNIYITILYKMGLVGGAVFTFLLFTPVFGTWRAIRRYGWHPDIFLLRALFFTQIFGMCFGAVNPLIESPFLAALFWINFGLMFGLSRQIRRDAESTALAAAA